MDWGRIWCTVFCGWDGDVDLAALIEELHRRAAPATAVTDEPDEATWVCRQIQEAF